MEKKLNPYITTFTKVNSRCIKSLNVNGKTLKLLGRNTKVYPSDLGGREWFLQKQKAQTIKEKTDKLDSLKLRILLIQWFY